MTATHFKRISNGHYVCSDECKFSDGYQMIDPWNIETSEDNSGGL